jgi:hypothetical protein
MLIPSVRFTARALRPEPVPVIVIETQGRAQPRQDPSFRPTMNRLSSKQNAELDFVGQCYNPTENGVKVDAI